MDELPTMAITQTVHGSFNLQALQTSPSILLSLPLNQAMISSVFTTAPTVPVL